MDGAARHHFKRGFFWLGSANLVTRLMDVASILVVLWFLTKAQMGLATLAWSVAVILEAFNGLGIGTAIVQTEEVTEDQLSSAWWFVMALAGLLTAGIAALSGVVAWIYNAPSLRWMVMVSGIKLLFVGAALIPLHLLNRKLRFKEIGAVQTSATLLASLTKIGLAAAGFGAWALVLGNVAHGLFTALGAYLVEPFLPRLHFAYREIKSLVSFGFKVALSGIVYHFYRNADYLIVGRFLGNEALGVYRVAFDVAMTPAMTLQKVVSRTALPVYSRLAREPEKMAESFLWVHETLAFLVAPVVVFLSFASPDLFPLIGKAQWVGAAPAAVVLAWAALLRVLAQAFPDIYHASGRPGYAVANSLMSLALLVTTFSLAIGLFSDRYGIMAVAYAWLLIYPLLLSILWVMARRLVPLRVTSHLRAFVHPMLSTIVSLLSCFLLDASLPAGWGGRLSRVGLYAAIVLVVSLGYPRLVLGLSLRRMLHPGSDPKGNVGEEDTGDSDETAVSIEDDFLD